MASSAAKLKVQEAPAPNRGLPIFGWWQPNRVAVHNGRGWRTFRTDYTTPYRLVKIVTNALTVAVSPMGTDGQCQYVAFDIDHGGEEAVRKVLAALPAGCVPLVSVSGRKGWHIWLFPSEPLPVETAVVFAKAIREKAGIPCETFPSGKRSKCLKWPLSVHPETGRVEVFVPLDDLSDTERLDTPLILQMLREGHYRTPAEVVEDYAKQHGGATAKKQDSHAADTMCFARGNHVDASWTRTECLQGGTKLVRSLDELAKQEELVHALMYLAGRRPVPLGKAFRCILPRHEEKHPSAAWYRQPDGHICYHDLHRRDGEEWYTLGEVFHALVTGSVAKLRPCDRARWLASLGLRCGFATKLVLEQRATAKAAAAILQALHEQHNPTPLHENQDQNRELYTSGCSPRGDWATILRVWGAVAEEAEVQGMGGFEEISLSARFLGRRAKVKVELANKAVNLFCVLSMLAKVPNSGGMKGDRFTLGEADAEEARRRFELLFPDGCVNLRSFKRELVAATLGEELAAAVFRRGADTLSIPYRYPIQLAKPLPKPLPELFA